MAGNAWYQSTKATVPTTPISRILASSLAASLTGDAARALLERVLSGLVLAFLGGLSYGFFAVCRINYFKAEVFFSQAIASIR